MKYSFFFRLCFVITITLLIFTIIFVKLVTHKNNTIRDQLVCMVLTTEENLLTRSKAVYETWVSF